MASCDNYLTSWFILFRPLASINENDSFIVLVMGPKTYDGVPAAHSQTATRWFYCCGPKTWLLKCQEYDFYKEKFGLRINCKFCSSVRKSKQYLSNLIAKLQFDGVFNFFYEFSGC